MGRARPSRGSYDGGIPYKVERWEESAACSGMNPDWFTMVDTDSTDREEIDELNDSNLAKGLRFCIRCSVRDECLLAASPEDKFFTTRGGNPPEAMMVASRGRPRKRTATTVAPRPGLTCLRGHDLSSPDSRTNRNDCRECKRIRDRGYGETRRAALKAANVVE